jgi:hypothetical protein
MLNDGGKISQIDYLEHLKRIIKEEKDNYKNTSEQFIDKLLINYKVFLNIGKNIEKLETNLRQTQCKNIILI